LIPAPSKLDECPEGTGNVEDVPSPDSVLPVANKPEGGFSWRSRRLVLAPSKLDESQESSGTTKDVPVPASLLPIAIKLEYPVEMEVDASAACSQEDDAPNQRSLAPPLETRGGERARASERQRQ